MSADVKQVVFSCTSGRPSPSWARGTRQCLTLGRPESAPSARAAPITLIPSQSGAPAAIDIALRTQVSLLVWASPGPSMVRS